MERVRLSLEAGRCAPATGVRGPAHAAARLADVVRGLEPGGGSGVAPVAAAARPDGDARGAGLAGRRPLSGCGAALRSSGLFPLPFQLAAPVRRGRRVVAARARGRSHEPALAERLCRAPLTWLPRGLS